MKGKESKKRQETDIGTETQSFAHSETLQKH